MFFKRNNKLVAQRTTSTKNPGTRTKNQADLESQRAAYVFLLCFDLLLSKL
jgi:hypothetical protein